MAFLLLEARTGSRLQISPIDGHPPRYDFVRLKQVVSDLARNGDLPARLLIREGEREAEACRIIISPAELLGARSQEGLAAALTQVATPDKAKPVRIAVEIRGTLDVLFDPASATVLDLQLVAYEETSVGAVTGADGRLLSEADAAQVRSAYQERDEPFEEESSDGDDAL